MGDNSRMSTVFENIISGTWSGRFVWADDLCVAFATIEPTSPGHVLVVPRTPYESWTDAPSDVAAHLMKVARAIGLAQKSAFGVARSGLVIAGFEVPHTHLHVIPLRDESDVLLSKAAPASDEDLDAAITMLREALLAAGHGAHVPSSMKSAALDCAIPLPCRGSPLRSSTLHKAPSGPLGSIVGRAGQNVSRPGNRATPERLTSAGGA